MTRTRYANAFRRRGDRIWRQSSRRSRTSTLRAHRTWKVVQTQVASNSRRRSRLAYQILTRAITRFRMAASTERLVAAARWLRRTPRLGNALCARTERYRRRRVPEPVERLRRMVCWSGSRQDRPIDEYRTLSSGTPSATPTSPARKTTPSCPPPTSASFSNRTASSTSTQPTTSRPPPPPNRPRHPASTADTLHGRSCITMVRCRNPSTSKRPC